MPFPRWRFVVILAASLTLAIPAAAETIILKNGRKIIADSVREVNGRVEYTIGENTYAIPKTSVDRRESGGSPAASSHADVPVPAMKQDFGSGKEETLTARVVHNGKLDADQLDVIEREGNKDLTAVAYFIAAKTEMARGSLEKASLYIERARSFLPDNDGLLVYQASVFLKLGRTKEAADMAERATRLAANNASAFAMLGYSDFQLNKSKEAIRALKHSLELQPDPAVEALLEKVQRESQAEASFTEEATRHFTLRFEGGQAPPGLRRQLLDTLENDFNDLVRDLGFSPKENISVTLYTDRQFFDVTQAPAWSGALNDGKLRIPINGITAVDSDLARVLKHELTHSFINQISRFRCPTWLHEGIAQIEEPKSSSGYGSRLSQLYSAQQNIPLNLLEGPFVRFNTAQATLAYAESLVAAEYIRDTYGISDLARILKRMGEGQSAESALRSTIHSGYSQLEQEVATHLKKTYGD